MVAEGVTIIEFPFPSKLPPHDPEYQYQSAFVPKLPPSIPKMLISPLQRVKRLAEIPDSETEVSFIVISVLWQEVVLHKPSARTKYEVASAGVTVIEVPAPSGIPPQEEEYHSQLARVPVLPPLILNTNEFPGQTAITDDTILLTGTEFKSTVIKISEHVVVLQYPSALTK